MSITLVKIPNPFQSEINKKEIIDFQSKRLHRYLKDVPLHDKDINFIVAVNGKIVHEPYQKVFVKDNDIISVTAKIEASGAAGAVAGSMWGSGVVVGDFATAWALGAGTAFVYGAVYLLTSFIIGYGTNLLMSVLAPDSRESDFRN